MENPIPKLRQTSIISKKPGFLSKKLKAPTTMEFNIFCWNFAHVFYLVMFTKACVEFFLFCLDLELLINVQKQVCRNQVFINFCK